MNESVPQGYYAPQLELIPSLVVQADFGYDECPQMIAAFGKMKENFSQEYVHVKPNDFDANENFEIIFLQKENSDSGDKAKLLEADMVKFLLAEGFSVKRERYFRAFQKPTVVYTTLIARGDNKAESCKSTGQDAIDIPPHIQRALGAGKGLRLYENKREVREDMQSGKLKPIEGKDCGHLTHLFPHKP